MHTLEVFYDYLCPYCLRGHELLKELDPDYPQIEIMWRPCEVNPSPNRSSYGILLLRGFYFAKARGIDLWRYNDIAYEITHNSRIGINDIDAVAEAFSGVFDSEAFRRELRSDAYFNELNEANLLAYDKYNVWAIPAYRMDGRRLDSRLGAGVSKKQLADFLDSSR